MSKGRRDQQRQGREEEHERRLSKAREKLAGFDKIDGAPFKNKPVDMQVATAATAIETGLKIGDTDCVYEGLVMLNDALDVMRRARAIMNNNN